MRGPSRLGSESPGQWDGRARPTLRRWTRARARDQLAALLPARERVYGADHRYTLATRRHLARFTGEAGDPAAAKDLLAALLPDVDRVLGPDHADTLATRRDLDRWMQPSKDGQE